MVVDVVGGERRAVLRTEEKARGRGMVSGQLWSFEHWLVTLKTDHIPRNTTTCSLGPCEKLGSPELYIELKCAIIETTKDSTEAHRRTVRNELVVFNADPAFEAELKDANIWILNQGGWAHAAVRLTHLFSGNTGCRAR